MRRFNYRLDVKKRKEAGLLSHREFIQEISRGLICSGLPIHTSGGHKWPSPKISVLHPLPTGIESEHEVVTCKLCSFHSPSDVQDQVNYIPFPGLEINEVFPIDQSSRLSIQEMTFKILFDDPLTIPVPGDESIERVGREDSETSSVPERLIDLELTDRTCIYRTTSEGGLLHPQTVLDWLRDRTVQSLPPVRKIIKTDIIISER